MKSSSDFKIGDKVRYTRRFMQSIGQIHSVIGEVVGYEGSKQQWVLVNWNDNFDPTPVGPIAIEKVGRG